MRQLPILPIALAVGGVAAIFLLRPKAAGASPSGGYLTQQGGAAQQTGAPQSMPSSGGFPIVHVNAYTAAGGEAVLGTPKDFPVLEMAVVKKKVGNINVPFKVPKMVQYFTRGYTELWVDSGNMKAITYGPAGNTQVWEGK